MFILNLLMFTIIYLVAGVMGYGWYLPEIVALPDISNVFDVAFVVQKLIILLLALLPEIVALPEGFDTTRKYHYAIDKMSEVGTLMIDGGLVDVLDTKDYFEQYNTDNSKSEVAPMWYV